MMVQEDLLQPVRAAIRIDSSQGDVSTTRMRRSAGGILVSSPSTTTSDQHPEDANITFLSTKDFVTSSASKEIQHRKQRRRKHSKRTWSLSSSWLNCLFRCWRRKNRFCPFFVTVFLGLWATMAIFSATMRPTTTLQSIRTERPQKQSPPPQQHQRGAEEAPSITIELHKTSSTRIVVFAESKFETVSTFAKPVSYGMEPMQHIQLDTRAKKLIEMRSHPTIQDGNVEQHQFRSYQELQFKRKGSLDDMKLLNVVETDDSFFPFSSDSKCRKTSWCRESPLTCNTLHEVDVWQRFRSGNVTYQSTDDNNREVHTMQLPAEMVHLKSYPYGSNYEVSDYEKMRKDALLSGNLCRWRNNIVETYAFCGTAMIHEAMTHGTIKTVPSSLGHPRIYKMTPEGKTRLFVKNESNGTQKLLYGLEMAEAVGRLHAYPDGAIVHNNINLAQFLLTNDGHVKLHDFSHAKILLFNEENQTHCCYNPKRQDDALRSPEEYIGRPTDEKLDVWSLGINLYSLLTDLEPQYIVSNKETFQRMLQNDEPAFVDPNLHNRSFAEAKLVDVIILCLTFDADTRIDVFELIRLLQEAVKENELHIKYLV